MHYADETYEVYDERPVTARKAHQCAACRETIRPGDRYVRLGVVFEGQAATIKRCVRCQAIHEHLRGTNTDSDAWPDEALNCGEDYEDVFGKAPPADIAALAFWRPGDPSPASGEQE